MLNVDNISAGYGKVEVLRNISFNVGAGEVVTIIGANGAGKSTTLKTLCGVIAARQGTISFDGQAIAGKESHQIVDMGMTMIPEGRQLFPFLTVHENLLMGAFRREARSTIDKRMEEVLELFPRVRERLKQHAGSLSGGEQQMVAIARGMMAAPKLLIFDEPSLGLSPLLVGQMFDVIRTVAHQVFQEIQHRRL